MAIKDEVTAQEIGRSYAAAVSREPTAQRLWVSSHRDYIELWLLSEPIDMDTRRRFFEPVAEMHDRFPDANARFHVINPSEYDGLDLRMVLPADAAEIPLRPS